MINLISGAIGVEVALNSFENKIYLPDILFLRNKNIKYIDVFSATELIKTPNNVDISTATEKIKITLFDKNNQFEFVQNLPLKYLSYIKRYGKRLFFNRVLDLQKCFIDVRFINANQLTNKALYFVFYYDEPLFVNQKFIDTPTKIIKSLELKYDGSKTYFLENRDLVNMNFMNLDLSFPTTTANGNPGINENDHRNSFLTLNWKNKEYFYRVPLDVFNQLYQPYKLNFQNIKFDLQNSYIETIDLNNNGKSLFFNTISNK